MLFLKLFAENDLVTFFTKLKHIGRTNFHSKGQILIVDSMGMAQPKKIAIYYEDAQTEADLLESAAKTSGHVPDIFDEEIAFYNHFAAIKPDLIIIGSESFDTISSILNTLSLLNFRYPILIISDSIHMDHLVPVNRHYAIKVCPPPYTPAELTSTIAAAFDLSPVALNNKSRIPIMVGSSPEIIRIKKMLSGMEKNNDAIFIQGEEGVGRELLAKNIHFASNKNEDAFIVVDIASRDLKNSPDGEDWIITDDNRSLLENGGGTIYFKAIDSLPLSFQGTFLQFFNEDRIRGIRIITSSEFEIDQLVQKGLFRKDLFYRLNVIKIDLPSLRERKADIPLLVDFFVTRNCVESNSDFFRLSDKVKKTCSTYDWPQNIGELERFIGQKALLMSEDRIVTELEKMIRKNRKTTDKVIQLKKITQYVIGQIESEILKLVLEKTNWNRRRAANALTISYKSLLNKIKTYNLN